MFVLLLTVEMAILMFLMILLMSSVLSETEKFYYKHNNYLLCLVAYSISSARIKHKYIGKSRDHDITFIGAIVDVHGVDEGPVRLP